MPELFGLRLESRNEAGMRMAEGVDGDAGPKIEIAVAVLGDQPRAFSAREDDILTGVDAHHGGGCLTRLGRAAGCFPQRPGGRSHVRG